MINRMGLDRIRRPTLTRALERFGVRWSPGGRVFLHRDPNKSPTQIGHIPTGGVEVDAFEFPAGTPSHVVADDLYRRLAMAEDNPDAEYVRAVFELAMRRVLEGPRDPIATEPNGGSMLDRVIEVMRRIGEKISVVAGIIS